MGTNPQAISHGWSGRNLLGTEWVLPTGEIIKTGALGSGAGWFSGDGPGPSLRGILRGLGGAFGGLGVFTKCSSHLHPWPGPAEMEIKGTSPYYETEVPPNYEYRLIEWPSWEKCAEAQYKIGGAGIVYAMHKTGGPGSHGSTVTGNNNEYYEKWDELRHIPWVSYCIVMAGNSQEENEYQVKVLDRIMEDTGGKIMPLGENPMFKNPDFMHMIKMCYVPRTAFRMSGAFACPLFGAEAIDHTTWGLSFDKEFRKKYDERGILGDDDVNEMWGVPFEGGHWSIFECGHFYDPTDETSYNGVSEMMKEGLEIAFKTPLSPFLSGGRGEATLFGPLRYNYHNWMQKIKKSFDPNMASEPSGYTGGGGVIKR
jgi:glycolate oxidase